jgi:hypothetical protein
MDAKHTPGPWMVSDGVVHQAQEGGVCRIACCADARSYADRKRFVAPEEKEANARLIAAAPDMLAALKGVLKSSERVAELRNVPEASTFAQGIASLKEIIAKAEGQS